MNLNYWLNKKMESLTAKDLREWIEHEIRKGKKKMPTIELTVAWRFEGAVCYHAVITDGHFTLLWPADKATGAGIEEIKATEFKLLYYSTKVGSEQTELHYAKQTFHERYARFEEIGAGRDPKEIFESLGFEVKIKKQGCSYEKALEMAKSKAANPNPNKNSRPNKILNTDNIIKK